MFSTDLNQCLVFILIGLSVGIYTSNLNLVYALLLVGLLCLAYNRLCQVPDDDYKSYIDQDFETKTRQITAGIYLLYGLLSFFIFRNYVIVYN